MEYTRKGLLKKQVRRAETILLLASVVIGAYTLRDRGSGVYGSLENYSNYLRRYLKQGLTAGWGLVNRGITMLPD